MLETLGQPIAASKRFLVIAVSSAALHLLVIGFFIHTRLPWVASIRSPGNEKGSHILLTYSPGRALFQTSVPNPQIAVKHARSTTSLPSPPTKKRKSASTSPNSTSPASPLPDSPAGADGMGSGNVTIALLEFFPSPKPNLSLLPRGTKGNVVLDVVIDDTGKIASITMTSGLGHGVDETVIATVRRWTFHPATKDGRPVASEQELLFHYEA